MPAAAQLQRLPRRCGPHRPDRPPTGPPGRSTPPAPGCSGVLLSERPGPAVLIQGTAAGASASPDKAGRPNDARRPAPPNCCLQPDPPPAGPTLRTRRPGTNLDHHAPAEGSPTPSTSTSPKPASNSHMRVGSHSTGVLLLSGMRTASDYGRPRPHRGGFPPTRPTPARPARALTPRSFPKSPYLTCSAGPGGRGPIRGCGGRGRASRFRFSGGVRGGCESVSTRSAGSGGARCWAAGSARGRPGGGRCSRRYSVLT